MSTSPVNTFTRITKLLAKAALLLIVWVILTAAMLEIGVRLLVDHLPERWQTGARLVIDGQPYQRNRVDVMMWDAGLVLQPDLVDARLPISRSVSVSVTTNRINNSNFGFRNRPVDYPVDAAVVGDSFGFCFTDYADCWVPRLEEASGLGIINLSQPGTASLSHWRMVNEFARPFEPSLVLWIFYVNDFNEDYGRAAGEGLIPFIPDAVDFSGEYEATTSPVLRWLRRNSAAFAVIDVTLNGEWPYLTDYERLFVAPYSASYRDGSIDFGQRYLLEVTDMDKARNQAGVPLARAAISDARDAVESWGGQFAVVLLPSKEEVYDHLTAPVLGETLARIHQSYLTMLSLCDELALMCIDTLPALQTRARAGEHLYYSDDSHFNAHGNAALTAIILDWMTANTLLED